MAAPADKSKHEGVHNIPMHSPLNLSHVTSIFELNYNWNDIQLSGSNDTNVIWNVLQVSGVYNVLLTG